jgi:LysW-gamma-L-lysine carboxypeptidase
VASPLPPEALISRQDVQGDIDLLQNLVAIPSTSGNEAAVVADFCRQMAARGLQTEIDAAGNAIGRIGDGPRHIVLLGHIDTVPGVIPVRIEDGVLHGRGSVDAKGPLATFAAAAALAAPALKARVTVVGAVGEETIGSPGATEVATWPAPDLCVIGEPSGWDAVCLGYRGSVSLDYTLRQAGRHTAGPGESVAEQAVGFWNALTTEADRRNAGKTSTFTMLGPGLRSFNTETDGFYDTATLSIGLRLPPGVDTTELLDTIRSLAGDAALRINGLQEGYRSDKKSALVPPFLRAIRAEGGAPRFTLKLGTSDMTVVGPIWKCPIVAYGPGDAALDHTPEECIVLDEYLRAVRVLSGVLMSL